MPQVSIIVPVYNSEQWLDACIQSVLAQIFTDWELILLNDGSTDNSAKICASYAQEHERIHLYSQENAGVSAARNAAISHAKGKYIAFLDSDDCYRPEFLSSLLTPAERDTIPVCKCTQYENEVIPLTREEMLDALFTKRLEGSLFNGFLVRFLFLREIINAHSLRLSGRYLEDEVFLMEYLLRDKRPLSVINEALYVYNENTNSATRRHINDFSAIFEDVLERKKKIAENAKLNVDWDTTIWAGYLIAVSNLFAPGGNGNAKTLKTLANSELFRGAIKRYKPQNVQSRNKRIVIALTRLKQYRLITLLYKVKNR
ncbi:MAG: glycosyltransferase [Oscillospiraceae bacterium]|jgi:glycosyltransferase involved in cell wall biosynthesis|nr:glycosyltransferase [Oscillospiraceae bacterium]